jgi:hypothetical protein
LGHKLGTPILFRIWDPDLGPHVWDPDLGHRFGTTIWEGDMGPPFETIIWPNVISKIKPNSSDMNEIILASCDVISKIKQNYSDMNEIILALCDAGYVQSCTGF